MNQNLYYCMHIKIWVNLTYKKIVGPYFCGHYSLMWLGLLHRHYQLTSTWTKNHTRLMAYFYYCISKLVTKSSVLLLATLFIFSMCYRIAFLKILNTCLELIPTRNSLPIHCQPWITHNLKRFSRRKQHAYNYACIIKNPSDWLQYNNIKKQSHQECHSAYNNYVQNLINPNTNAISKCLWNFIKSKKHDLTGVGPFVHNGIMYADPQD